MAAQGEISEIVIKGKEWDKAGGVFGGGETARNFKRSFGVEYRFATLIFQPRINGLLAQSVERWSNKPTVKSSNLLESTISQAKSLMV